VALGQRRLVEVTPPLARERRQEKKERRAREMEVRQQDVDDLEVEVAVDEQRGSTAERSPGRALEGADGRGAHGDDASRSPAGVQGLLRHVVALGVDLMVLG